MKSSPQSNKEVAFFWLDEGHKNNLLGECLFSRFKAIFGENNCHFLCAPDKEFMEKFNSIITPSLMLCSGQIFDSISPQIIQQRKLIAIVIFCYFPHKYIHLKKKFTKLRLVSNSPRAVTAQILRSAEYSCTLSSRFFDDTEEKTFIPTTDHDQKSIIEGAAVQGNLHEYESNILYPLYFGSHLIQERIIRGMIYDMEMISLRMKDQEEKTDLKKQMDKLEGLIHDPNPNVKVFLETYTDDGIYKQFNSDYRKATAQSFSNWKNYAYCLRGSMCALGEPIRNTVKVYRGLSIPQEMLQKWVDQIGQIVLFPSYTSTTLEYKEAVFFMKMSHKKRNQKCLMEIEFVKDEEQFQDSLNVFQEELWPGIYYPVDIQKYSVNPQEKEILFPPFYPIKIANILTEKGMTTILLQTPAQLNIGKRNYDNLSLKCPKDESASIFLNKILELSKINMIQTLNIGGILRNILTQKELDHVIEIIQHNQYFKSLYLHSSSITVEKIKEIKSETIQTLCLCWNKMGENSEGIGSIIERFPNLKELNLKGNEMKNQRMSEIMQVNLEKLVDLDLSQNKIGDDGAKKIGEKIGNFHYLTKLDLSDNEIGNDGIKILSDGIKYVGQLSFFNLRQNKITEEGAKSLSEGLQHLQNLSYFDIGSNKIKKIGAVSIASKIHNLGLISYLSFNACYITNEGAIEVIKWIQKLQKLSKLILGCNHIKFEGAKEIAHGIVNLTQLTFLSLSSNEIKDEGARELGEKLKNLTQLSSLDLCSNEIGPIGAESIGEGIKDLKELTHLDLCSNKIKKQGALSIGKNLENLTKLSKLDLGHNSIGNQGAENLYLGLKNLSELSSLKLSTNKLGDEGVKKILEGIKNSVQLSLLDLGYNRITNVGAKAISETIKNFTQLSTLVLSHNKEIDNEGANSLVEGIIYLTQLSSLTLYGTQTSREKEKEIFELYLKKSTKNTF